MMTERHGFWVAVIGTFALIAVACSGTPEASVATPAHATATPADPASSIYSPVDLPGLPYISSVGGYTFNYDPKWSTRSQDGATDVVAFAAPSPPKAVSDVAVSVIGAPEGSVLSTYGTQDAAFIDHIPGARVLGSRGERLGGQSAYSLEYLLPIHGAVIQVLQLTTVTNGQVFSVIYSTAPSRFQADLPAAGLIARSFTFTSPPDTPREGIKPPPAGKQVFPLPVRLG
ncbi:MAG: PsbP [Actinomycetota bacterium]|nr:PsbP [Actinomycetota bacterium]